MILPDLSPARGLIIARYSLALMFAESLVSHLINYNDVLNEAIASGLPFAQLALPGSLILESFGILALITGRGVKLGTLLLTVFVLSSTFVFFPFWALEGHEGVIAQQNFVKNLALSGSLLLIYSLATPVQTLPQPGGEQA